MTGISDYARMSTFCVRRSKQFKERLEPTSTFCILYRLTLRLMTLFLWLRYIIKRQQKPSVFSKQKKMTVEPEIQHTEEDGLDEDGEAEEVSRTSRSNGLQLNEYCEKIKKVFGVFRHLLFRISPSFF